jgi:hypothetical protein
VTGLWVNGHPSFRAQFLGYRITATDFVTVRQICCIAGVPALRTWEYGTGSYQGLCPILCTRSVSLGYSAETEACHFMHSSPNAPQPNVQFWPRLGPDGPGVPLSAEPCPGKGVQRQSK